MSTPGGEKDTAGGGSLAKLWGQLQDSLTRRLANDKYARRDRLILLLATISVVTFLILPDQHFLAVTYKAGEIAIADIRSPGDFLIEDDPLTDKKRADAEAVAPVVYDLQPTMGQDVAERLTQGMAQLIDMRGSAEGFDRETIRATLSKTLGTDLNSAELSSLARIKSERLFVAEVRRLLARIYSRHVVADHRSFAADRLRGVVLLDSASGQVVGDGASFNVIDLPEVRALLANSSLLSVGDSLDSELLKQLLGRLVRPNLIYNRTASEEKRKVARAAVNPVLLQVKRGEMIVRVGERISPEQSFKLQKIFSERPHRNRMLMGAGTLGLAMILFYFPFRFARKNIRKFNPSTKDLLFLSLVTVGNFLVIKLSFVISSVMGGAFPAIETASYAYLFPFAAGAILVRIVLNSEVALVYCAICAPLYGIMFNSSLPVVIYSLLGGIVGAHGVRHCKDRSTIYKAGLKVSVANVAVALSFQLGGDTMFSLQTVYCVLFAFAGGIVNAVFVAGTIPLIESLFLYTTDIKLLELANLNSSLLRDLMVRAPGTYHHSVLVGTLVEAAAEAINANPLLARVAAYYHDIGKVSKPQYFIENLGGGENRHDKLSPSMSALILISHVKEGVELARQHRLGQPIIDMIRQSHGSALISFFYQKAKGQAGPDQPVDERDFRYPGPKPQTREAGLVLLADCVEAASRTLADPTPARIQGMVQKIISNIFTDGQLDECELTLKNLHEIAKSFIQILTGIYHHRIDYPEPAFKEKVAGGKKQGDSHGNEPPKAVADLGERTEKGGAEDIKRLGMSR
jgi:putative nucleotidyltransferase with HDIG domain